MELRVIDFAKCSIERDTVAPEDLKSAGRSIYEAFATIGFVYLTNTGISDAKAAEMRSLSRDFFSLDEAIKSKYSVDANTFGYVATGVENNDPENPSEFHECFDITGPGFKYDSSKWPDTEINGFSCTMKGFMEKLRALTLRIFDALAVGMNLKDKDYFRKCHSRIHNVRNWTTLRNLYYPVFPKDYKAKEGEMRLGEHSDWGSLTILFQDSIGGLQVQRANGEYIEATPIPGTVLINIGDALQFWTGGRLKSTKHRIPMPDISSERNIDRSSMVYFVMPDNEVLMSEIEYEDIPSKENPSQSGGIHKPITVLQHLHKMYSDANLPPPQE